jgi:hypothetical protein
LQRHKKKKKKKKKEKKGNSSHRETDLSTGNDKRIHGLEVSGTDVDKQGTGSGRAVDQGQGLPHGDGGGCGGFTRCVLSSSLSGA